MRHARLLPHLHRVFDTRPLGALALRVNGGGPACTWDITGDTLRIQRSGGALVTVDLAAHTIASLADYLAAQGFTLDYESGDLGAISAAALIPGPYRVTFT